jgi:uncharacterized membrane protein
MWSTRLDRLSPVAGLLGGLLLLVGGSLPMGATGAGLLILGQIPVIIWLTAIYSAQRRSGGRLGTFAYGAAVVGVILIMVRLYALVFVWHLDPAPLEALTRTPLWIPFSSGGLLFMWAIMALGTIHLQAGILPRWTTMLWLAGFLLFLVFTWDNAAALATGGMMWSGIALWWGTRSRQEATLAPVTTVLQPSAGSARFVPLDATRGLIMVLMAIDHASLLIRGKHSAEFWDQPLPHYADAASFLTRFVTHVCAPGFFLLMGAGMVLFAESRRLRGWSWGRISGHLLLRGLLLMALEQLFLDPILYRRFVLTEFGVLFALGGAMMIGALLLRLRTVPLLATGVGVILGSQVVPVALRDLGKGYSVLARLMFVPGATGDWFILYPVVPWLGIAVLGMAFGRELLGDRQRAYRRAGWAGLASLALFVLVRSVGGFGNFHPPAAGWIGFLNVTKYPPSLSFTLLALGLVLLLVRLSALAGEGWNRWRQPLLTFGRVALFFYFAHWYLLARGQLLFPLGSSLPVMYASWAVVLVIVYPICQRYEAFKRETAPESAWRLF